MLLEKPYQLQANNQTYAIVGEDTKIPIYTERSIDREAAILASKIEEYTSKKNHLFIWCAPYLNLIYEQLSLRHQNRMVWFSPTSIHEQTNISIIHSPKSLSFFINQIEKQFVFTIEVHPYLKGRGRGRGIGDAVLQCARDAIKSIARRIKTIQHFQKIWEYNYKRNFVFYSQHSILFANKKPSVERNNEKTNTFQDNRILKPDAIVCGGKSIDGQWRNISNSKVIWCADTALPALLFYKIQPGLVFSIDSGKGSMEHFITGYDKNTIKKLHVVLDSLSFPKLYHLPFARIYIYKSTYPPLEQCSDFQNAETIYNARGDILGTMIAIYQKLFSPLEIPVLYGADNHRHSHYITHLRGSSYYQWHCYRSNRFISTEKYFYGMSKKMEK